MPNHVENDLTISGNRESIDDLFCAYKSDEYLLDARRIIIPPNDSPDIHWCIANWGTKWGMYDFIEPVNKPKSAFVTFLSAWSPPIPLIKEMSRMFPDLNFTLEYFECGCAFKGVYKVKAGEVIKDETSEYRGRRGG